MRTNQTPLPLAGKQTWLLSAWLVPLVYILLVGKILLIVSTAGLLTTIFLALLGLLAAWVIYQMGWQILTTPLDIGFLSVTIALLISTLFSLDPSRSWRMFWNWTAPILAFYIGITLFRGGAERRTFVKALLIALSVFFFFGYREFLSWVFQWYTAFGVDLLPNDVPRISGFTGSPNLLAVLLNFGLLLSITYRTAEGQRPWLTTAWIVMAIPLLILTGSRSALLGLLISGGVLYAGYAWQRSHGRLERRTWLTLTGGFLLAGLSGLLIIYLIRPETLEIRTNSGILYRNNFWAIALEAWKQQPWIGNGLDTYGSFYMILTPDVPPKFPFRAAHSWWFSLLAEAGLAGIGSAVFCWGLLGRFLWKHRRPQAWSLSQWGLLAALIAFTIHACFDTPEPWILMLGALFLAALIASLEPHPQSSTYLAFIQRPLPIIWAMLWMILLIASVLHWRASRTYESAVTSANEGDWQTAAALFDQAQAQVWYSESSFYLGSGLAHGILANQNAAHLQAAVEAYERLIALEPGWSSNYANLAALYWQAGEHTQALETLKQAVAYAPELSLYQLNLALWHEKLGDERLAHQLYATLYNQSDAWHAAQFWETKGELPLVSQSSAPQAAGWEALTTADWEAAARLFSDYIRQSPYDSRAYIGWGITRLQVGDTHGAELAFKQATLLGDRGEVSHWAPFLLPAEGQPASKQIDILDRFTQHSTFGLSLSNVHIYPITLLNRLPPPYDLLPQLRCFTLTPTTDQHLTIIATWQTELGSSEWPTRIEELRRGDENGLTSCSQIAPPR